MAARHRERPELLQERIYLARLIDAAIRQGHGSSNGVWTNDSFGQSVGAHESTVRSWCNSKYPEYLVTPRNITPILRVLFGKKPECAAAREEMRLAWCRAKGVPPPEPPPPPARVIGGPKPFTDAAEIIDLAMDQPTPDNQGRLVVPYTLRIHPDKACRIEEQAVELGVAELLLAVESDHWFPARGSPFRGGAHTNTGKTAVTGAVLLTGPHDGAGRIDGDPLGTEPELLMESRQIGDGPITMSARVPKQAFVVTPIQRAGQNEPGKPVEGTRKVVLDALFSGVYEADARDRLIIARAHVAPQKRSE